MIKNKAKSYQHYQQSIIISMLVLIKKNYFSKTTHIILITFVDKSLLCLAFTFFEKKYISLQAFLLHTRKKFSYINFKDLNFKHTNYPLTVAERKLSAVVDKKQGGL